MFYIGCDLGSTTGKVVILNEDKDILASSIVKSARGPQKTFELAFRTALENSEALKEREADQVLREAKTVTTGYGRTYVEGFTDDVSEISCHAKGATALHPQTRLIIDIGGQDCKVIAVDEKGKVLDFQMNDKCSAWTGRFFEVMCRVLDLPISELAEEALKSSKPSSISKQCSVFAESEVIGLINSNVPLCDIAAGIHDSIARRIHGMAYKVGIDPDVILTDGCAQNKALRKHLEKRLRMSLAELPINPQLMGAYGAALYAMEHAKREEQEREKEKEKEQ